MYFLYFKCKAYILYIHSISGGRVTRTKCYDNYSSRLGTRHWPVTRLYHHVNSPPGLLAGILPLTSINSPCRVFRLHINRPIKTPFLSLHVWLLDRHAHEIPSYSIRSCETVFVRQEAYVIWLKDRWQYYPLLYGFAESWILIGRRAVRKMRIRIVVRIFPYPDRFPVCQFDRLEFETFLHVY
jgi:hypothetical protein